MVEATFDFGDGCYKVSSWGTPVESGNNFSVVSNIVDAHTPTVVCTQMTWSAQFTYGLGKLPDGNYTFALTTCIDFAQYGAIACGNKASIVFQVEDTSPKPPVDDGTRLVYQDINGESFVNATVTVHPCYRLRGWSDASQIGNSFTSNVTLVDDTRLMIACIAIDTFTSHSYDLGHLTPGQYSFTLNVCNVIIGWGPVTGQTNSSLVLNGGITTNCNALTMFFNVPGGPNPQPPPVIDWHRIFGQFALIIIIILRLLGIPTV